MSEISDRIASEVASAALIDRVTTLLRDIRFPGYDFKVAEGHGGVFVRAVYSEADVYGSIVSSQWTRKWLLSPHMTTSEIVQTIFKLCLTSYEHRCREAFIYKGARIFGPHFDIEDLVVVCKGGRENAGGRP